jgi:hypothetical protein
MRCNVRHNVSLKGPLITMNADDPTERTYQTFRNAYNHFNRLLFEDRLPPVMFTLNRLKGAYGYAHRKRFRTHNGGKYWDEIALNPGYFHTRTCEQTMSTLVHEMTHVEEFYKGTASNNGYHNLKWGPLMERVGLMPSDTGRPDGKKTGYHVTHYIIKGGPFEKQCRIFLDSSGFKPWPMENQPTDMEMVKIKRKLLSKSKYSCRCFNMWGAPGANFTCNECRKPLLIAA